MGTIFFILVALIIIFTAIIICRDWDYPSEIRILKTFLFILIALVVVLLIIILKIIL